MSAVNGVGEPCAGEPHARFEGSRWRGLETEHRLDKDAEVVHPTGKPTERRLRVLQPEGATAPVPDPTDGLIWTHAAVSSQLSASRQVRNR
jgi:hypothetical protein